MYSSAIRELKYSNSNMRQQRLTSKGSLFLGHTIHASFTNEIFGQLLSNSSRYAANLNMKAVSFFLITLYNSLQITEI